MTDFHSSGISLYVHIPFCKTKCPYCDFNTYQGIESLMSPFLDSLNLEIELWGRALGIRRSTQYSFGGGTPSYLPQGQVGRILATARESFRVAPGAEITVEANPGDLTEQACHHLLSQGVNRLSIGAQAFNNDLLTLLGRRHNVGQATSALTTARAAGFSNVNLDFMYGIPQQSMDHWSETMALLTDLAPDHVSLYCLTLEDGTPLQKWVNEGKLPDPDPDLAADMYHLAETALADARIPSLRNLQLVQAGNAVAAQHGLLAQPSLSGRGTGRPLLPESVPVLGRRLTSDLRRPGTTVGTNAKPGPRPHNFRMPGLHTPGGGI